MSMETVLCRLDFEGGLFFFFFGSRIYHFQASQKEKKDRFFSSSHCIKKHHVFPPFFDSSPHGFSSSQSRHPKYNVNNPYIPSTHFKSVFYSIILLPHRPFARGRGRGSRFPFFPTRKKKRKKKKSNLCGPLAGVAPLERGGEWGSPQIDCFEGGGG